MVERMNSKTKDFRDSRSPGVTDKRSGIKLTQDLEQKHREGYKRLPVLTHEFSVWEKEQVWEKE
jgi:hypothetical protein